jgi:ubiquinone biosynthesis monooxygenase Coq7
MIEVMNAPNRRMDEPETALCDALTADDLITGFDRALRTLTGTVTAQRRYPAEDRPENPLSRAEQRHAAGLMRVNHTGEVCAQALYSAQALVARNPEIRRSFAAAAREEEDHLAWTQQRLAELGARPSFANPFWYAGSFAIGLAASIGGDGTNLGFVVETERQVEEHLTEHMAELPQSDARSRTIVAAMRDDEARHGASAREAGASELPGPVRVLMRATAKLMTITAYRF